MRLQKLSDRTKVVLGCLGIALLAAAMICGPHLTGGAR